MSDQHQLDSLSPKRIGGPKQHKRRRYILTGLLTVIPMWFTWLVLSFLFRTLSGIGNPIV